MNKIGLYFGTFNPIHKGHLALGNYFAEHTDLDQVWFVVSPQNPFKVKDSLLEDQHRLELVRLALKDQPNLNVNDVEFSLPKPSYTIHTLEHLVQIHPDKQFVLLMGEDNLEHFDQWKQSQRIVELVQVYVYPRSHEVDVPKTSPTHKRIQFVKAPKLAYSSTEIRKILKEGKSAAALIPSASWVYLNKKGFYK
ncbi:MAG: nicotinate (nicotinamide) nucleotide adenylyltransferase [Flavobacteriaceae bacterium]|nr:nicotinate (nicotinamide) nucleotide adenylyltransferase [Flavobacteriaceae bacterium]MDG1912345.1 nicotinate (nicotinamide) nucleotide adenylyltransferase [Flavobacteriaceae bacterium]